MKHLVKPITANEPRDCYAAVRVRVAGFAHQSIRPNDVVDVVRQVPNFHLAGLNEIVFDPDETRCHNAKTQAYYCQAERRIRFLRLPELALFRHVLHHEIGHHVFSLVISSKVKTLWVNRIALQTPSVSAYGASCAQEDFAEAYALYVSAGAEKGTVPEVKMRFIRELVFSADPWTLKERTML